MSYCYYNYDNDKSDVRSSDMGIPFYLQLLSFLTLGLWKPCE